MAGRVLTGLLALTLTAGWAPGWAPGWAQAAGGSNLPDDSAILAERRLMTDLLTGYNVNVRPALRPQDAINVTLGFNLISIEDLDERTQALTVHTWLKQRWRDPQLVWERSEYGGLDHISLPPDQVWKPDITLYNGMGSDFQAAHDTMLLVTSSGDVHWIPPVRSTSFCPLDLSRFPYDTQTCAIKYGSWVYDGSKVGLQISDEHQDVGGSANYTLYSDGTNSHLAWQLSATALRRDVTYYPCCPEPYVDISVTLTLKRFPGYLHRIFVAPSVIIAFVLPATFLLPPDVGEKTTLGVGILISQVLLLMMLEDFIPTAHPTVPLLGLYYMANIILIGFSIVFSTVVVNIWKRGSRPGSVPGVLQGIFLGVLGRLLFVRREDFMSLADLEPSGVSCDPAAHDSPNEDKAGLVARVTSTAEWRQFSCVVDRLLFLVYVIVLLCVTIGMLS